jgi:hypothetical protein
VKKPSRGGASIAFTERPQTRLRVKTRTTWSIALYPTPSSDRTIAIGA